MQVNRRRPRRALRPVLAALLALAGVGLSPLAARGADGAAATVAAPCDGSSQPTLYPNNHRLVRTEGGRLLGLFDPHGSGQQVVWRDGGGAWQPGERGPGTAHFLPGAELNDRPASLALARDSRGEEHAWVVHGGYGFTRPSAIVLRRLSDLDAPAGPTIGPAVEVQAVGSGNVRPDIAFEGDRGVIVWVQRNGDAYDLVTTWFTDLDRSTPGFAGRKVLYSSSSSATTATLVETAAGVRVVARAGKLRVFAHASGAPLDAWTTGSAGVTAPGKSKPTAVALDSGEILATFQSKMNDNVSRVVRFSNDGKRVTSELTTAPGYAQPAIATDGTEAWVVMVRRGTTRAVVSQRYTPGAGWGPVVDELSAGAHNGGDYAYPNTLREFDDGKLVFLVDGARCPSSSQANTVLSYQRAAAS